MKRFLFSLMAILFSVALQSPAVAQQSLSDLLGDSESAPEPAVEKLALEDYANQYFTECLKSNSQESLEYYAGVQCACASAHIMRDMTDEQMASAFGRDQETRLNRDRLLIRAYIPCLESSVKDFVYDQCISGDVRQIASFDRQSKACECVSEGMAAYAQKRADRMLNPGVRSQPKITTPLIGNALAQVVTDQAFLNMYNYHAPKCAFESTMNP